MKQTTYENAQRLVRLLTATAWIEDPQPMTRREKALYVRACTRPGHEWRDEENAKTVAGSRLVLARTPHGFLYGTDAWTDTAGHTDDFGYIPYKNDPHGYRQVLDCPLTLALEAMDNDHGADA